MQDTAVNTNASVVLNLYNFANPHTSSVTASDIANDPDAMAYLNNRVLDVTGDYIGSQIDASTDPEAIATARTDILERSIDDARQPGGTSIPQDFMDFIDQFVAKSMEWMNKEANEENRAAGDAADGSGEAGGKGKNWLVLIMQALSENAGKHLGEAIELAGQIGALESSEADLKPLKGLEGDALQAAKDHNAAEQESVTSSRAEEARKMTELQGQMQAEMQLFKMAFEAAASLGKTVGQGFQSMARAQ